MHNNYKNSNNDSTKRVINLEHYKEAYNFDLNLIESEKLNQIFTELFEADFNFWQKFLLSLKRVQSTIHNMKIFLDISLNSELKDAYFKQSKSELLKEWTYIYKNLSTQDKFTLSFSMLISKNLNRKKIQHLIVAESRVMDELFSSINLDHKELVRATQNLLLKILAYLYQLNSWILEQKFNPAYFNLCALKISEQNIKAHFDMVHHTSIKKEIQADKLLKKIFQPAISNLSNKLTIDLV